MDNYERRDLKIRVSWAINNTTELLKFFKEKSLVINEEECKEFYNNNVDYFMKLFDDKYNEYLKKALKEEELPLEAKSKETAEQEAGDL